MILERTIRQTQPAAEPVTLAQARAQLRVDINDEDTLITALIIAARERVENYTNRYFAPCEITQIYSRFPAGVLPLGLGLPDLTAVNSIKYIFENTEITMAPADYVLDIERAEIRPVNGWPAGVSVKIDLEVGVTACPAPIVQAILLYVTDFFQVRGNLNPVQVYDNRAAVSLSQPYRVLMGI